MILYHHLNYISSLSSNQDNDLLELFSFCSTFAGYLIVFFKIVVMYNFLNNNLFYSFCRLLLSSLALIYESILLLKPITSFIITHQLLRL